MACDKITLKDNGNETVTKCNALKMLASDNLWYTTAEILYVFKTVNIKNRFIYL